MIWHPSLSLLQDPDQKGSVVEWFKHHRHSLDLLYCFLLDWLFVLVGLCLRLNEKQKVIEKPGKRTWWRCRWKGHTTSMARHLMDQSSDIRLPSRSKFDMLTFVEIAYHNPWFAIKLRNPPISPSFYLHARPLDAAYMSKRSSSVLFIAKLSPTWSSIYLFCTIAEHCTLLSNNGRTSAAWVYNPGQWSYISAPLVAQRLITIRFKLNYSLVFIFII